MHARPQGKMLLAALLADSVKTVLTYDAKRIGRTQPAFWSFIWNVSGQQHHSPRCGWTDLTGSVHGRREWDAGRDGPWTRQWPVSQR